MRTWQLSVYYRKTVERLGGWAVGRLFRDREIRPGAKRREFGIQLSSIEDRNVRVSGCVVDTLNTGAKPGQDGLYLALILFYSSSFWGGLYLDS